jgi:hypothetical protein
VHCPQTVPLKPQEIGRHTDTRPLLLTTAPHNNAIKSLQQELLGKMNGQADNIHALQSSNAKLRSSNNELKSLNDDLKLKVNGLALLNAELLGKVRQLAESNNDMSNILKSVS